MSRRTASRKTVLGSIWFPLLILIAVAVGIAGFDSNSNTWHLGTWKIDFKEIFPNDPLRDIESTDPVVISDTTTKVIEIETDTIPVDTNAVEEKIIKNKEIKNE